MRNKPSDWRLVVPSNRNGQIGDIPAAVAREVVASGYYCEAFNIRTGEVVPIRPDYSGAPIQVGNVRDACGRLVRCMIVGGRAGLLVFPDDLDGGP